MWIIRYRPKSQFKLCSLSSQVNMGGASKNIIEVGKRQNCQSPQFFCPEHYKPVDPSGDYSSRDCIAFVLRNSCVIARTDFVLSGHSWLHDDQFNPDFHITTLDQFQVGKFDKNKTVKTSLHIPHRTLEAGINLTASGSGNYAHFINETIPRLLAIDEKALFLEYPLLVDGWIGGRLTEVLAFFNKHGREIIALDAFENVLVENLVHITSPSYAPQDFHYKNIKNIHREFQNSYIFSREAADRIRQYCLTHSSQVHTTRKYGRLIYIKRKKEFIEGVQYNSRRNIVNVDEVELTLHQFGFQFVDVTSLSFIEQVATFSNARVVVSPLGAALTNCVFCKPNATIIGLASYYSDADYTYHARMISSYGHKYLTVLGPQYRHWSESNPSHYSYFIHTDSLRKALASILTECVNENETPVWSN